MSSLIFQISESEFSNTVQSLGLKEGHITILQKLYNAKKSHISNFVPKISYRPLRYVGIEWRLEAQFTSRFEPDVIKPYVILDITTKKDTFHTLENIENNINEVKNSNKSVKDVYTDMKSDDSVEHILLKCDLPNLINMISVLETAWRESHAGHVRKIEYAINRSEAPTENGKTE